LINEHPENKPFILVILLTFHLEISGKNINDEHPENKSHILVSFLTSHLEISGKDINDEHQ
jgi:hypothetical protein